ESWPAAYRRLGLVCRKSRLKPKKALPCITRQSLLTFAAIVIGLLIVPVGAEDFRIGATPEDGQVLPGRSEAGFPAKVAGHARRRTAIDHVLLQRDRAHAAIAHADVDHVAAVRSLRGERITLSICWTILILPRI